MMDGILDTLFSVIKTLLELLPEYTPSVVEPDWSWIIERWSVVDYYFPVGSVLAAMAVVLSFEAVVVISRPILKFIRLS